MLLRVVERRMVWFLVSGLFILAGFGLMGLRLIQGDPVLNFGTDFAGGSSLMMRVPAISDAIASAEDPALVTTQEIAKIRTALGELDLANSVIQVTRDQELIIKTRALTEDQSSLIHAKLNDVYGQTEILEIDFIGPSMGAELREKSIWIVLAVSGLLMVYITWRFDFAYGMAALLTTTHDALAVMSFASLLYLEIDLVFVASILTVLGYSINDTIVIFDRIRENIQTPKQAGLSLANTITQSLKETMGRTINTVATVILVLLSLIVFGGTMMNGFSIVLLWGVIVGTYSSIFIASPIFAHFYRKPSEGADLPASQ
jgi:preprotein translocase subunit SecF